MPGDTKPHVARQARKRKRAKAGTIAQLKTKLWAAIDKLSEALETDDPKVADLTKLAHALSQSAASYLRVVEVGELEARVDALETAQKRE